MDRGQGGRSPGTVRRFDSNGQDRLRTLYSECVGQGVVEGDGASSLKKSSLVRRGGRIKGGKED